MNWMTVLDKVREILRGSDKIRPTSMCIRISAQCYQNSTTADIYQMTLTLIQATSKPMHWAPMHIGLHSNTILICFELPPPLPPR